jgi:hypothetical protein
MAYTSSVLPVCPRIMKIWLSVGNREGKYPKIHPNRKSHGRLIQSEKKYPGSLICIYHVD